MSHPTHKSSDPLPAGTRPGVTDVSARLHTKPSQTMTSEFLEDGRPDRAAARLTLAASSPDTDETTRIDALRALEELAEHPDGRVARRLLVRFYRAQNHSAGVNQIHSLALQLGTPTERVHVLVERNTHLLDEGIPLSALIAQSLTGVDSRRLTPADIAYSFVRTWLARPNSHHAVQLLDLAAQYFERAGAHDAALSTRLNALREHAKFHTPSPRAAEIATEVLAALHAKLPAGILSSAATLHEYPAIADRAATLLQEAPPPEDPRGHTDALQEGMRTDLLPASTLPRGDTAFVNAPTDAQRERVVHHKHRLSATITEDLPALLSQSTAAHALGPLSAPLAAATLQTLIEAARADKEDIAVRERLAEHWRLANVPDKELAVIGELVVLCSTPQATATHFRRSSELLLTLGDHIDALRVRLEAVYLSCVTDADVQFIYGNTRPDQREEVLDLIRTFLPHLAAEEAVRIAKIGARLLLQEPADPATAWDLLYPIWFAAPNTPLGVEVLLRVAQAANQVETFRDGVCALASQGALRDPDVVRTLMDASRVRKHIECYILLHICASAANPFAAGPRRALEHVITVEGRSRASAYRQVLGQLRDFSARRAWTDRTATALESERRFAEAAELLIEQHMADPSDAESLDRALTNLERERQYPRIISILENEISRITPNGGLLNRLRELSRIVSVFNPDLPSARASAVRIALAYPTNVALDAHARAELADAGCEAQARYLEQRAELLGKGDDAADIFLEAADTRMLAENFDSAHVSRLLFNAHKFGASSEAVRYRWEKLPKDTVLSQDPLAATNTRPLTMPPLEGGGVDAGDSAFTASTTTEISDTPPTAEAESEHSPDNSLWSELHAARPNERRRRLRNLLSQGSLEALFDACVKGGSYAEAIAMGELFHMLHFGVDDARQDALEEALRRFRPVPLARRFDAMLQRLGVSEDVREKFVQVLGDPQEALERCPLREAARDETIDSSELAGIHHDEWICLYLRNRLPDLQRVIAKNPSLPTGIHRLVEALPWTLAWYGTGSLLVVLRRFCRTHLIARPSSLEELLNAAESNPIIGTLMMEWADAVISATPSETWEPFLCPTTAPL